MIDLLALVESCAPSVHPATMVAIVSHESSRNPYAIGINDGSALSRQPRDREEAIAMAQTLLDQNRNFDSGLGQINSENMEWLGLSVADLFDPCTNLEAAATVLEECYGRAVKRFEAGQAALQAALSCYNTGTFHRGFENGYVAKVTGQVAAASAPTVPALAPAGGGEPAVAAAFHDNDNRPLQAERGAEGVQDVFSESLEDAFVNPDATKELASVGGGLP